MIYMFAALFTMARILSFPFPDALVSSHDGAHIAYVLDERGQRSVWFASAPDFKPAMLWQAGSDDGQELSDLLISDDGKHVVYVRGGDHDANWPEVPWPNPQLLPQMPHMQVISLSTVSGNPVVLGDGDAPAIAPDSSRVAFVNDGHITIAPIDGAAAGVQTVFDRGQDRDLAWSPDGSMLAFTSNRDDHSFIGIFRDLKTSVQFLAPTTYNDAGPVWSPDSKRVAFVRGPGNGGPPQDPLAQYPQPWSIQVADVASGSARTVWQSQNTLRDSFPGIKGPQLQWAAGDRLVFISERNNWPHPYAVSANGGAAQELTTGAFMVEDTALSVDRTTLYYTADAGNLAGDDDRRHIFSVPVAGGTPAQVTHGTTSEWWPSAVSGGVAYVQAGAQAPTTVAVNGTTIDPDRVPADFPSASLVVPQEVSFRAKDGWLIHGQLFAAPYRAGEKRRPAIVFVHGGPPRQMLLTWHYFDYYSNSYAVNQYLASRGFDVLSVNYRLGIGYGFDFQNPAHAGPAGASEYQDVVAGAQFLQRVPGVDANRIGIWGGSYGGYLTAMALAKNSNIFKAGVDMHGVHDWSDFGEWFNGQEKRYQQIDEKAFLKTAWFSSPDAYISTWRSPVLLIQADDDRNVHFHQMVDLVERLKLAHVPFEQVVIPDDTHDFRRYASWLSADEATVEYFTRKLMP